MVIVWNKYCISKYQHLIKKHKLGAHCRGLPHLGGHQLRGPRAGAAMREAGGWGRWGWFRSPGRRCAGAMASPDLRPPPLLLLPLRLAPLLGRASQLSGSNLPAWAGWGGNSWQVSEVLLCGSVYSVAGQTSAPWGPGKAAPSFCRTPLDVAGGLLGPLLELPFGSHFPLLMVSTSCDLWPL